MPPKVEVQQPSHAPGRAPYVSYALRITNVTFPITVAESRKLLELLPTSVPDDAQVQWGSQDVWVTWRRDDPLGKYVVGT